MSSFEITPPAGWDRTNDAWNSIVLKADDRRATVVIKEISLAAGGTGYRVTLYDAPEPHGINGEYVGEEMAETPAEIFGIIEDLERDLQQHRDQREVEA